MRVRVRVRVRLCILHYPSIRVHVRVSVLHYPSRRARSPACPPATCPGLSGRRNGLGVGANRLQQTATDCNRLLETARDCSFRQGHYSCEWMPGSAEWLVVVSGLRMLNLFTPCSFGLACFDKHGHSVVYFSPMAVCVCTEVVIAHKMFACLPARTTPARCPGRGWRRRTLR